MDINIYLMMIGFIGYKYFVYSLPMHPLSEEDVISPYNSDGSLNHLGEKLFKKGEEILRSNIKLGVVILSGGEGSRLGLKYPKGLFVIEDKTLFEWHIQRIEEIHKKYGTSVRLFIMTSESTHNSVSEFFNSKNYSFLSGIEIFKQSSIEAISISDRSVMRLGTEIIKSPMGNGDFYDAINKLEDWGGVEAFNVISVDNILANVIDEVFIGAFYSNKLDVLSKAVEARDGENVGAFFKIDGHIKIREYSESENNSGKSAVGNICNHLFSSEFVKLVGTKELPLHEAKKKISFTDSSNNVVVPSVPNGIKREKFIFDSFIYTKKNQVMSVPRSEEFSPLKNNIDSESDNVKTCTDALKKSKRAIKYKN